MSNTHLMHCAPCQYSWVLLHTSIGSATLFIFEKVHLCRKWSASLVIYEQPNGGQKWTGLCCHFTEMSCERTCEVLVYTLSHVGSHLFLALMASHTPTLPSNERCHIQYKQLFSVFRLFSRLTSFWPQTNLETHTLFKTLQKHKHSSQTLWVQPCRSSTTKKKKKKLAKENKLSRLPG